MVSSGLGENSGLWQKDVGPQGTAEKGAYVLRMLGAWWGVCFAGEKVSEVGRRLQHPHNHPDIMGQRSLGICWRLSIPWGCQPHPSWAVGCWHPAGTLWGSFFPRWRGIYLAPSCLLLGLGVTLGRGTLCPSRKAFLPQGGPDGNPCCGLCSLHRQDWEVCVWGPGGRPHADPEEG